MENKPEHIIGKCTGGLSSGTVSVSPVMLDFGGGSVRVVSGHPLNGQDPGAGSITAYDPTGDDTDSYAYLETDDVVQLSYYAPEDKYYISALIETAAILYTATLAGSLASADSTATVTNFAPIEDGPFRRTPTTPTVDNTYGLAGQFGDDCLIRRTRLKSSGAVTYKLVQVKHKELRMVRDVEILSTNLIEHKRDVVLMYDDHTDKDELSALPLGNIGGHWIADANAGGTVNVDVGAGSIPDELEILGDASGTKTTDGQCIRTDVSTNGPGTIHTLYVSHHDGPTITERTDHADNDDDNDIPVKFGYDDCGHTNATDWKTPCKWFDDWVNPPTGIPDDAKDYVLVFSKTSGVRNCRLVEIKDCP